MNQPGGSCHLCDGTSYYLDSGFYYCSECNTRTEGVQEAAVEDIDPSFHGKTHTIRLRRKRKLAGERDETDSWTSWHGHNYVLVGLVDELIELGADRSFKFVVLQLWSKYLNKLEAAFISTTDMELPKFALNQCEKDYELIYGIKKNSKPYLKKKKIVENATLKKSVAHAIGDKADAFEKVRLFRKMRRAVVKTHYDELRKSLVTKEDAMKRLDERLNETIPVEEFKVPEVPKEVEYNAEAQRIMDRRNNARLKQGLETVPWMLNEEMGPKLNFYNVSYLSRIKLLALIALGLRISKQDIQISDLLRWIAEGHLSYLSVTHLFPHHLKFSKGDRMFLTPPSAQPSYCALQKIILNIARSLGLPTLPRPNTLALCQRYLRELALPSRLIDNVERLIVSFGPLPPPRHFQMLENHEAVAMAYVVVVLKMLLALDGFTEHRISDVACAINSASPADSEPLFAWDEWVKFIECRKATISHEHFVFRSRHPGVGESTNTGPYLSYLEKGWRQTEGLELRVKQTSKLARKHSMTMKMESCVDRMPNYETPSAPSLKIPATLTPLSSYLDAIKRAGRTQADILATDFTRSSVAYLLQPKEALQSAKRLGLRVKYCHGTALKSYLVIPPVNCNLSGGHKIVDVTLKNYGKETQPSDDSQDDGDDDELNASVEEEKDLLVLFIPHRDYWLLECEDYTLGVTREFETRVAARLSDTFQWLLAECAAIIEMSTKELYSQIVHVESRLNPTCQFS